MSFEHPSPTLEELVKAGEVEYVVLFGGPVQQTYAEAMRDVFAQGVAMGKKLAAKSQADPQGNPETA